VPLNPLGRTGMNGRGLLGRFGPNHAADPIVTRCVSEMRPLRKSLHLRFTHLDSTAG
jgi:hypothetical protein